MKKFLILQIRPEDEAAEDELAAFKKFGGLKDNEIYRFRIENGTFPNINLDDYCGVILGGGPTNISDEESKKSSQQKQLESHLNSLMNDIIENDMPFLGSCYGLGLLCNALGGEVSKEKYDEDVGVTMVTLTETGQQDPLTKDIPKAFKAFTGHKEACQNVPEGAVLLATSKTCPVQMIRTGENVYGAQFHTELDPEGLALRIQIYKHHGYFPAEAADALIASTKNEDIVYPELILQRFVKRYRT